MSFTDDEHDASEGKINLIELDAYKSRDTLIPSSVTLVEALHRKGLLMPHSGFLKKLGLGVCAVTVVGNVRLLARMHLVPEGCVGLTTNNGRPEFLRPGRYTLLSPLHNWNGSVTVNDPLIKHGPVTIVTINKGELGISWKNGQLLILEEGQHLLIAPHVYAESKNISAQYIEMGPLKRMLVHEGQVGIAYDTGKLEVLPAGLHIRNSPTYRFSEFVSVQQQVKRLDTLKVNTNDGIAIKVNAIITYKIQEPAIAFRDVKDVTQALIDRAEATLTSIFLHHSIDEIAPTLPAGKGETVTTPGWADDNDDHAIIGLGSDKEMKQKSKREGKRKQKNFENDKVSYALFSDIVREAFLSQLKESVEDWGVVLLDMSIEMLEFHDPALMKLLADRASNKLKTAADRANIAAQAATGVLKAQGQAQEQQIKADADLYTAEQRAKGAKLQEDSGLAKELAVLRAMKEVVEAAGKKTTFIPWNMKLDLREGGSDYWLQERNSESLAKRMPK